LGKGTFYFYPDQGYFYEIAQDLGRLNSIEAIFSACIIDNIYLESGGAHFLFGTIAFFANNYFDGNSVLLQSLWIVFVAILSNIFVFKVLKVFFSDALAAKYTIVFALASPILYYSPWLLRDVHITFLYCLAIYLSFRKLSITNSILFLVVFLITYYFRIEHSLVLLLFPIVHLYFNKETNKLVMRLWPIVIVLGISIVSILIFMQSQSISQALEGYYRYDAYTSDSLDDNGLGARLYNLPFGLKHFALVVNSQLTPLPPWIAINSSNNFYINITAILLGIVTIYWSYVFLFISFATLSKGIFAALPKSFILFLGIVLVFLILNTSNINVRRIMAVYPIIFMIYVYIKENNSKKIVLKNIHQKAVGTYILLLVTYIILKAM